MEQFRKEGIKWQTKLEQIAEEEKNWVGEVTSQLNGSSQINRFWLSEMYLRIRIPLPVNSSPAYVFPQRTFESDDERLRYTALLIRGICDYKDKIDK